MNTLNVSRYLAIHDELRKKGWVTNFSLDRYGSKKEVCTYCGEAFRGLFHFKILHPHIYELVIWGMDS